LPFAGALVGDLAKMLPDFVEWVTNFWEGGGGASLVSWICSSSCILLEFFEGDLAVEFLAGDWLGLIFLLADRRELWLASDSWGVERSGVARLRDRGLFLGEALEGVCSWAGFLLGWKKDKIPPFFIDNGFLVLNKMNFERKIFVVNRNNFGNARKPNEFFIVLRNYKINNNS
jgi:hypothetical protein